MNIRSNSEIGNKFAEIMLSGYSDKNIKARTGVHRSEVISCPIKPYNGMTGEAEQHFAKSDVGIWLLGELCHVAFNKYFDAQEKQFDLGGIKVTVDAIYNNLPIELKTTRKKIYKREDLLDHWIHQLVIAMAVMDVDVGYLVVMNIITFGLTVWEVKMPKDERVEIIQSSLWSVINILDAVKNRDASKLIPKYKECITCTYRPVRGIEKKNCRFYRKIKDEN